jgi:hypothetical protein
MAWLDANEYFTIAAAARDRVDDLLSSTELAIEAAAIADQRGASPAAHSCDVRGCVICYLPV